MLRAADVVSCVGNRAAAGIFVQSIRVILCLLWFWFLGSDLECSSSVCFLCSYEGDKVRRLYEGEGVAFFEGGNIYKVSV